MRRWAAYSTRSRAEREQLRARWASNIERRAQILLSGTFRSSASRIKRLASHFAHAYEFASTAQSIHAKHGNRKTHLDFISDVHALLESACGASSQVDREGNEILISYDTIYECLLEFDVDAARVDLSTCLGTLGSQDDGSMARALSLNLHGAALGRARLGLEGNALVLRACEWFDIHRLREFGDVLAGFIEAARAVQTEFAGHQTSLAILADPRTPIERVWDRA